MVLISRRSMLQGLAGQLLMVNAAPGQTRVHRKPKQLPTGAVTRETAAQFIQAGACAIGVGGELAGKTAIAAREFDQITQNARDFIQIVKQARGK